MPTARFAAFAALLAVLAGPCAAVAEPDTQMQPFVGGGDIFVQPLDQAAEDPSFLAFREELLAIIARKDVPALKRALAADMTTSFGAEGGGPEAFHAMWELDAPETSSVWQELGTVLAMGGIFLDRETFSAPYIFSAWPDAIDAFFHVATVTPTELRARPAADAASLRALPANLVLQLADTGTEVLPDGWMKVIEASGKSGYVEGKAVRSPIDFRAGFQKTQEGWKMTYFVAGD